MRVCARLDGARLDGARLDGARLDERVRRESDAAAAVAAAAFAAAVFFVSFVFVQRETRVVLRVFRAHAHDASLQEALVGEQRRPRGVRGGHRPKRVAVARADPQKLSTGFHWIKLGRPHARLAHGERRGVPGHGHREEFPDAERHCRAGNAAHAGQHQVRAPHEVPCHRAVSQHHRLAERPGRAPQREVRQLVVPLPRVVDHDGCAVAEVDLHARRRRGLDQLEHALLPSDNGLGVVGVEAQLFRQLLLQSLHITAPELVRARHRQGLAEHGRRSPARRVPPFRAPRASPRRTPRARPHCSMPARNPRSSAHLVVPKSLERFFQISRKRRQISRAANLDGTLKGRGAVFLSRPCHASSPERFPITAER